MSVFHNNALIGSGAGTGAAASAAADITKSLRFNSGSSAYLSRTPSSTGSRSTWTYSCWVKRTAFGGYPRLFGTYDSSFIGWDIEFKNDNRLEIHYSNDGSNYPIRRITTAKYRDPGAWMHVVVAVDLTVSGDNSVRLYVNGSEVTDFDTKTNSSSITNTNINTATEHRIGYNYSYSDFYLADIYFIDGSQLSPTSFGSLDTNGVWQAAAYSGTFGTNGFHLLDFANESTVGHDSSGNENDFTANNIVGSITNYSNDISIDSGNFYLDGRTGRFGFDGSSSTYIDCRLGSGSNSTTNIIWTPTGGIAGVTKIEVNSNYATHYRINEGTWTSFTSNGSTVQIYSGSAFTLTKLEIRRNNNGGSDFGHRVTFYEINDVQYQEDDPTTLDVLFDVPVNGDQSDTGAGGEVSGNYAVLQSNFGAVNGAVLSPSNGNLTVTSPSSDSNFCPVSIPVSSGKWYVEVTAAGSGTASTAGVWKADIDHTTAYYQNPNYRYWQNDGSIYDGSGGTSADYGGGWGAGDVVGIALDMDNGKVFFSKNGTFLGSSNPVTGAYPAASGLTESWVFALQSGSGTNHTLHINTGQKSYSYSAPTGYKALCTTNLPTPTIADGSDQSETTLWTGDGNTGRDITGLSFSPDWTWIKSRSLTKAHALFDTLRGANKRIQSNSNNTETTHTDQLSAFISNGFTVEDNNTVNDNNATYVAWNWNAGANSNKTYTVKVVSDSGNKYRFDGHGTSAATLDLAEGSTYVFDQSDSSNSGHPLRFSTTSDGTHNSGNEYTTGVTTTGTPGSAGAKTTIVVASGASTLYYYCSAHSGMGGQVNTNSTAGSTRLSGSENASAYDSSQTWSNGWDSNLNSSYPGTRSFDGDISTGGVVALGSTATWTVPNSGYAISSSLRVYGRLETSSGGFTITFSDSSTSTIPVNATKQWHTISGAAGKTITSIAVTKAANGDEGIFHAVEIDGKILLDSGVTPVDNFPTINSVVKANPDAGFSIVTWTASAAGSRIAHGLNAAPEMIIARSRTATQPWVIYHSALGRGGVLQLHVTDAVNTTYPTYWGNNEPNSSVFDVYTGQTPWANNAGDMVAYCFAPVAGYSAFGTYEGNGSSTDGPFVQTDFRPALIILKPSSGTGNWTLFDTTRDTHNVANARLHANLNDAEATSNTIDILSNGFKIYRAGLTENSNGVTYIYAAFAENPFQANGGLAR